MRSISTVIPGIQALIPNPAPSEVADNMTVLSAELRILQRAVNYTPPESADDIKEQWDRLETILYRYMPPPTAYPWAQAISVLVMGA